MTTPLIAALDAMGRIEAHAQEIADLEKRLEAVPLWRPSLVLKKQARQARQMIRSVQDRIDGRLVVTLIGPSGAGKSTIFNALAGTDHLSPTGAHRPTTRELVALADDPESARHLLGPFDPQDVVFHAGPAAARLEHLILVDTPDTDTTLSPSHVDLLLQVVDRSDVLICVFDAQNPKRRDHADFMAPLIERFSGGSLVAVVNKCDRLAEEELSRSILPDFEAYLKKAWPNHPEYLLPTSARRHLKDPQWDPQAMPRNALDRFAQLEHLVKDAMNRPGAGRDRRVANAAQVGSYLMAQVVRTAGAHASRLARSAESIAAVERQALHSALGRLGADDGRQLVGIHVRLYQALAQRWLGPVGWLVAIWSRLVVFGSGMTALLRFGNPLHQIWGAVSAWKRFKESRSALDLLLRQPGLDQALDRFRKSLMTQWPDIADELVRSGFDPAVHDLESVHPDTGEIGRTLDQLWSGALDRQINHHARQLSHPILQLLFNLPVVALMGYVGWMTMTGFFRGDYLTSDFFLHAVLTIALVLLLSFFLLQSVVRLAVGKDRIQRRAFAAMERTADRSPLVATHQIADQVSRVAALVQWATTRGKTARRPPSDESRQ